MYVLALETSEKTGTVAALSDDRVIVERPLNPLQRTAQSLAPGIVECLAAAEWRASDLNLVAVVEGPGSFTGLRVGVTTAKTLAYAADCEVMGVNTLAAIAQRAPSDVRDVFAVMNAQRQQLFCARFRRNDVGRWDEVEPTQIVDNQQWLARLQPGDFVTGPGLARGQLSEQLPDGVLLVDQQHWMPTAAVVGQLGYRQHQAGRRDDLWKMTPRYYRKSAAEEKWEQRHD